MAKTLTDRARHNRSSSYSYGKAKNRHAYETVGNYHQSTTSRCRRLATERRLGRHGKLG